MKRQFPKHELLLLSVMKSTQKIDVLIDKAKKLAYQNKGLQAKSTELEREMTRLKQLLLDETVKNAELVNKIKIVKLAQNIGSSNAENADVIELKKKINEYIKEIDHCITMLND
jgi:hypothetical protein